MTQQDEAVFTAERIPNDRSSQQVPTPMADVPPKPQATDTF
jgi:hypothetical protein